MRSSVVLRPSDRSSEGSRVAVIIEGVAALVALVVFVGAVVGTLTWGLIRLVGLALS